MVPTLLLAACSSALEPVGTPATPDLSPDAGVSQDFPATDAGDTTGALLPDEVSGSRLSPTFAEQHGSDGSLIRSFDGWFDAERNELCEATELADGVVRCAPPAAYATEAFSDAACAIPVLAFRKYATCSGQPPAPTYEYMSLPSGQACHGRRLAAYPESAPLALATMYQRDAQGACVATPLQNDGSYEFYARPAAIAEVPPEAFVAFAESTVVQGERRIRVEQLLRVGADGSKGVRDEYAGLVDTARNEKCSAGKDDVGVSRCFPGSTSLRKGTRYFTTATCSADSYVLMASSNVPSACAKQDPRDAHQRYFTDRIDACHSTLYARPSSPPHTGPLYYSYNAACNPAASSPGDMSWPPTAFTTTIATTVFAEATQGYALEGATFYGTRGSALVPARWTTTSDGLSAGAGERVLVDAASGDPCTMTILENGRTYCVGASEYARGGPGDGDQYADAACTEPAVYVDRRSPDCATGERPELADVLVQQLDARSSCRAARLYRRPSQEIGGPGYQRDGNGACVAVQRAPDSSPTVRYRQKDLVPIDPASLVEITTTRHVR